MSPAPIPLDPTPHLNPVLLGGALVVVFAGLGALVAFGAGARAANRITRRAREVTRVGASLTWALALGGVITGVQWAVVSLSRDPAAWAVALGLPAVFAGGFLARMFAVTDIVTRDDRHQRRARR